MDNHEEAKPFKDLEDSQGSLEFPEKGEQMVKGVLKVPLVCQVRIFEFKCGCHINYWSVSLLFL